MGQKFCTVAVLSVLMQIRGNVDCCSSELKCRCYNFSNDIHADCSDLGLKLSPYFWTNVTRINLSHNRLIQLPNRKKLPDNVTYLDLSHNSIRTFRNFSFKGLWQLSVLKLNSNRFRMTENLSLNVFADLINIKKIDLSENTELTFRILPILTYGLQNSTIFSLYLNKIHCTFGLGTEIRKDDVRYLKHTNLTEIHLSSNRIELMEKGAIHLFPKTIKRISIADNRLTFGTYVFELETLKNLEWINASIQYLSHNPNEIIHNKTCVENENKNEYLINTQYYSTGRIHKAGEWRKLFMAYENRNGGNFTRSYLQKSLQNSTNGSFPLPPNIKKVFYNESGLRYEIPTMSLSENNVEELYVQNNILYSWKGPVEGMKRLRILNLSNNFCSAVSKSFFQYLGNLSELYLNNNLLGFSLSPDTEGQIFASLTNLTRLELRANRISNLPYQVFKELRSIMELDLADNTLTTLDFSISTLKNLQFLDLSENQIQFLTDTNMKEIDRQTDKVSLTLNLLRNPILCNCKTLQFLKWMVKGHETKKVNFKSFENYSCTTSSRSEPFMFSKIKENIEKLEKECNSYMYLIISVSFIILLFFFILLLGLVYRYRWKIRYFYYMTKSRYHGYKSVRSDSQSDFKYDAFVSYADEDLPFIQKMIIELEKNNGMRLCIHHRDFVPGYDISENIITAVNKSRKTVIILSPNFIKSSWCMYELHIAKMEEIYSRDNEDVLFLIFYEAVPVDKIPLSVMDLINQRSYVEFPNDEYGDPVFWRRICKTLSDEVLC
ncbi:toll-like receptor 4 [Saccostrea echinata]|uniref:toll-like receptor 4 n=1 Tax=Saccostrea echinata TaxID=191078 RepID=UPI002A8321AC|nr:toll-like receptor 4 [Saccostrea echinata]